jgi:aspartate kinase
MKFGGTSVATVERIGQVADRAIAAHRAGSPIVVVVSAIAGETNRLLALAEAVGPGTARRELDLIAATGEQVTAGLMVLAITKRGVAARALLGHQVRIVTNASFGAAQIERVETDAIRAALGLGEIVVVAGFQGVTAAGEITTLGRGGSDTTAVALAAALAARTCEIYTDVDGVYTADPSICPDARKRSRVSFAAMLALAERGAKVLHAPCVAMARDHDVPILVAHAHREHEGTWVTAQDDHDPVVGIAIDRMGIVLAPQPEEIVRADAALARAGIAFDRAGEVLVVAASNQAASIAVLAEAGVTEVSLEEVTRISLIGRDAAAVSFAALAHVDAAHRVMAGTSPEFVTVIAPRPHAEALARVLHAALLQSVRRYQLVA